MNTVEQKTYTLDEADALLPKLIPMLTKARELKRAIESIAAGCDYEVEKLAKRKPDINNRMRDLQLLIEQIEDLGAYLKDLDIGLCDFLSTYEDRDIMLCWKLGEPHIAHWHELDEGFSSRQNILDLSQLEFDFDIVDKGDG